MILAQSTFPGTFDTTFSNGKGHHPPVPEPTRYGFLMVSCALALFIYVRFVRRHNRCACHRHA